MTSFSFLNIFDAFELDVNVVNFVYDGKTRLKMSLHIEIRFIHIFWPKRKFGQGNVFTGVCHSVNRGGVPDQAHPPGQVHPPWQVHPPAGTTPLAGTPPPCQVHPPGQVHTPQQVHSPGQVHPPLAGTPPWQVHPPGRYTPSLAGTPPWAGTPPRKQQTPEYGQRSAGTHPAGMHSCL